MLIRRLDDGAPPVRQNAAIAFGTLAHADGFDPLALKEGAGGPTVPGRDLARRVSFSGIMTYQDRPMKNLLVLLDNDPKRLRELRTKVVRHRGRRKGTSAPIATR